MKTPRDWSMVIAPESALLPTRVEFPYTTPVRGNYHDMISIVNRKPAPSYV